MATIREKRPGVWEVRVFPGCDGRGRPTQMSRTVHGGKRDAQRLGHANPAMTLRVDAHAFAAADQAAAAGLGGIRKGGTK